MDRQILDAFNFRLLSNRQKFNDGENIYGHNFKLKQNSTHMPTSLPLCNQTEMTANATKQSCVRGYHVYKDVGAAVVGEELVRRRER